MKRITNLLLFAILLGTMASCNTNDLFAQKSSSNPSVMITSDVQAITDSQNIPIKITFKKPVKGFDASDIIITGGSLKNFSGEGAEYYCTIVPETGAISIQILSGASTTDEGHENEASEVKSFIYETPASASNKNAAVCFDPDLYRNKHLNIDL